MPASCSLYHHHEAAKRERHHHCSVSMSTHRKRCCSVNVMMQKAGLGSVMPHLLYASDWTPQAVLQGLVHAGFDVCSALGQAPKLAW